VCYLSHSNESGLFVVNGETRHPAPRAAERDRTAERALQQAKAVKYGIRERERAK
jgi:hypothetical protein